MIETIALTSIIIITYLIIEAINKNKTIKELNSKQLEQAEQIKALKIVIRELKSKKNDDPIIKTLKKQGFSDELIKKIIEEGQIIK